MEEELPIRVQRIACFRAFRVAALVCRIIRTGWKWSANRQMRRFSDRKIDLLFPMSRIRLPLLPSRQWLFINYDAKGPAALQSWEEAGVSYHTLFDNGEKPETEIASQVETLATGQSDAFSKIEALYTYVSRQIRYVAIEIGVGGYQPHLPADVYKNKYGDCKDKASLLISMLNKIGMRGYPALVGTRGDVEADPKAPTLATFDHMIVALPIPANLRPAVEKFPAYDSRNNILWIDPTSETDPLGQLPEMDQGVFALIAYPDRGDLQRIPQAPPEQNGSEYAAQRAFAVATAPDGGCGGQDILAFQFQRGTCSIEGAHRTRS